MIILHVPILFWLAAVMQEKVHQNLISGVEGFDKASMKHTTTQEKNVLPDPEGSKFLMSSFISYDDIDILYVNVNMLLSKVLAMHLIFLETFLE